MNPRMAATAAAVLAATALTASPALAASNAKAAPAVVYIQTRGIDKTYLGAFSGDWTHCNYITKAKYAQTAGCTKGTTVNETISGNTGFSAEGISSSVGFNVSYSTSVSANNSVKVLPGGYGWFDVGFRYKSYRVGMESRTCANKCGKWTSPDWVKVQQHLGNTFHYFGTGAAKS